MNSEYFCIINTPEKIEFKPYLLSENKPLFHKFTIYERKLMQKILDEIKCFIVANNTFYKNEDEFKNNREVGNFFVRYPDKVDGLEKDRLVVKKLVFNRKTQGIFELRIDNSYLHVRFLVFPISQKNVPHRTPFVTITYAVDKKGKDDGENIVNNLRDSSFRIKQSFLNTEENKISYYLNDSEEG